MKISTLIKYLSNYIEVYGDMELIFNIPTIANFTACESDNDRGICYLELKNVSAFSDNDLLNNTLIKYCNEE